MAERKRLGNRSFKLLGIPVGSVLAFRNDASVTCRTLDDLNGVEYQGKPRSLSALAKELKGCSVSGYQYFSFNGTLLCNIGNSVKVGSVIEADTGSGDEDPLVRVDDSGGGGGFATL